MQTGQPEDFLAPRGVHVGQCDFQVRQGFTLQGVEYGLLLFFIQATVRQQAAIDANVAQVQGHAVDTREPEGFQHQ